MGSVVLGGSLTTTAKKQAVTRSKGIAASCWQHRAAPAPDRCRPRRDLGSGQGRAKAVPKQGEPGSAAPQGMKGWSNTLISEETPQPQPPLLPVPLSCPQAAFSRTLAEAEKKRGWLLPPAALRVPLPGALPALRPSLCPISAHPASPLQLHTLPRQLPLSGACRPLPLSLICHSKISLLF